MSADGGREFVYHQGRFYSRLGELQQAEGGGPTVVGVWEMRRASMDGLPAGAHPVTILPGDADKPSDEPGKTWQERAVKAELEAADLRARLGAAERSLKGRDAADRRAYLRDRQAQEVRAAANEQLRLDVLSLAEQVAQLYRLGPELGRAVVRCEGYHGNHPDGADHAYDPELCEPRSATAVELVAFMAQALQLDHPAASLPLPGPRTLAEAHAAARRTLTTPGKTFDEAVTAALVRAAEIVATAADQRRAEPEPE